MLITKIEIGTINGEVVEVAINVVINSQWRAAAHGIGRHAGQRSGGGRVFSAWAIWRRVPAIGPSSGAQEEPKTSWPSPELRRVG